MMYRQVYVDDPLLIDGYKFDIGLYTMITSIDPLRIYVFEGDVLLRYGHYQILQLSITWFLGRFRE